MAFEHLKGQQLTDKKGNTYIISDIFAVIYPGENRPDVYEWGDIKSVKSDGKSLTISTEDKTFNIGSEAFSDRERFTAVTTVVLSSVSGKAASCNMPDSLLPDKRLYENADIPQFAVTATGGYSIKDEKSTLTSLYFNKSGRLLWSLAIIGGVLAVALFQLLIGFTASSWWYLTIGAFFCAVGVVAIASIVLTAISKIKFSSILQSCNRLFDGVAFAVCEQGVCAVEECVYSGTELIGFQMDDSYLNAPAMFVIMRRKTPVVWIPKSLFTKDELIRIEDYLSESLSEI